MRPFPYWLARGVIAMLLLSLFGYEFTLLDFAIGVGALAASGFVLDRVFGALAYAFPRQFALQMKFPTTWAQARSGHYTVNTAPKALSLSGEDREFYVGIWLKYNWVGQIIRPTFIKCQFYQYQHVSWVDRLRRRDVFRRLHPLLGIEIDAAETFHAKWQDHYSTGYISWKSTVDHGGFRWMPDPVPQLLLGDPFAVRVVIKKNEHRHTRAVFQCQVVTDDNRELLVRRIVEFH